MRSPWALLFEPEDTARLHLVVEGAAWLRTPSRGWIRLEEADLVLLPRGPGHILADRQDRRPIPIADYPGREVADKVFHLEIEGSGRRTVMTCCSVGYDGPALKSLTAMMDEVIVLRADDRRTSDPLLETLLAAMAHEVREQRAGSATMLARLADVVIGRIIRRWAESASTSPRGWLAAVNDPRLGRAIVAMHERPGEPWSAPGLAVEAGMSKSSFYERFVKLTGVTPAKYLAELRMALAQGMIHRERRSVAQTAASLGYQSEAAFSRAFKRLIGRPPSMTA